MSEVELMKPTSNQLKKIYLDRTKNIQHNSLQSRGIRKMCSRLEDQFDAVWLRYEQNNATFKEWEDALDEWLNAEQI